MLQRGERVASGEPLARLVILAQLRVASLRAEIAVGSADLARAGCIGIALALQTIVLLSPGHFRPATNSFFALLVTLGTLASLAVCVLAALPLRRVLGIRARQILAVSALVTLAALSVMGATRAVAGIAAMQRDTPYSNDGAVMDLYAAKQVLHDHNPYFKTSIVAALAEMNAPAGTTTPLMQGQFRGARVYPSEAAVQQVFMNVVTHEPRTIPPEFESKYNYPAGSFLFILPFVWAGLHDMRFLYALAILAMGAYIAWRLPRSLRWTVPLIVLADVPLVVLTAGGQPDPLYGVFLMVGYAEWSSPWLSPTAMGISCGTKQLAWFLAPFYLVLIVQQLGWREAARRAGIMAGVFLLLNGAFILHAPGAYVTSIAGPMTDPMFPLGIGVMALFVANVLPMLPKLAFSIAELVAWLSGIVATARLRYLPPAMAPALAALPLFFAWRSLVNYFYLVPLLALAVAAAHEAQVRQRPRTKTAATPIVAARP